MDIAVYSDTLGKYYRCISFIQTIIIKFSFVIKLCKHNYPLTLIIKPEINFIEIVCILMTFIAIKGTEMLSELWKCSLFKCSRNSCPPTSSLAFYLICLFCSLCVFHNVKIMMLILEFMNVTFHYYEKHRGTIIYFESGREEVQVKKYTLLA